MPSGLPIFQLELEQNTGDYVQLPPLIQLSIFRAVLTKTLFSFIALSAPSLTIIIKLKLLQVWENHMSAANERVVMALDFAPARCLNTFHYGWTGRRTRAGPESARMP